MFGKQTLLLGLALLVAPFFVDGAKLRRAKAGKQYDLHENVNIVVNKVGPFNNPTETYRFYSLPFCQEHSTVEQETARAAELAMELNHNFKGKKILAGQKIKMQTGETLAGDRRESSPYEVSFNDSVDWRLLCKVHFVKEDLSKLKDAINNNYFFEMFVEDLPMWGYLGDIGDEDMIAGELMGSSKTFLFTHLNFIIGHNNKQIVSAKVTTDVNRKVDITDVSGDKHVEFSYSVSWVEEKLTWKQRMIRYKQGGNLPKSFEIHWLSIINSIVLVLLLTAFLTIILLRVLKNDFSRYMELDDDTIEEEESGWKLIHGDVFRFPENSALLCAFVGVGNQLIITTLCHLGLSLTGFISTTKRGSLLSGAVILYCLTSFIAGYSAINLYRQMNGKNWVRCVLLTSGLFPVPTVAIFIWVNSVALAHGSTSALPFTTILTVTLMFSLVSFPTTIVGGIMAKNYGKADFNAPTRTTKVAREIPTELPWYRRRPFQILIAGFLPFSAIYVELHYIFASMWGHQVYTLFGILFLAFILLVIVTSCITVALLYFQLAREDHRWWWAAFINGGMTGIFIYAYSFHYYFQRSGMTGILQLSFYFGYMAIVSLGFFIMLGSAGFQFSLVFVKYIYSRVKCD